MVAVIRRVIHIFIKVIHIVSTMEDSMSINSKDEIVTSPKKGRCAGCGKKTYRYSVTYHWYICVNCNSRRVLEDIADHVMNPNG